MTDKKPTTTRASRAAHRAKILDSAVQQGKIPPSRRPHYAALHRADPEGTEKLLDQLAAVGQVLAAKPAPSPEDDLYKHLFSPATTSPNPAKAGSSRSRFVSGASITVDPLSPNPLLDDLRQVLPHIVRQASAEGPPPTIFESGDLPPFTGSGIDPSLLRKVGWAARHPIAAASDRGEALRLFERYSGPEGALAAEMEHGEASPGNVEYQQRFQRWASGLPKQPAPDHDD